MRNLFVAFFAVSAVAVAAPAFAECADEKTTAQSIAKPLTTTDSGVKTSIGPKISG